MKSTKFLKTWLVVTLVSLFFCGAMEIKYENFAKTPNVMRAARPISKLEIPGREANRLALRLATKFTKFEELTIWDYNVRIVLTAIILTCSISGGYIVAFCWILLNTRANGINCGHG